MMTKSQQAMQQRLNNRTAHLASDSQDMNCLANIRDAEMYESNNDEIQLVRTETETSYSYNDNNKEIAISDSYCFDSFTQMSERQSRRKIRRIVKNDEEKKDERQKCLQQISEMSQKQDYKNYQD
jgi:hypothetical protein